MTRLGLNDRLQSVQGSPSINTELISLNSMAVLPAISTLPGTDKDKIKWIITN